MPVLPGNTLGYINYSSSPHHAGPDAQGKLFRGQLMFDGAGKLRYVVVMWQGETAAPAVVWTSGPDASNGSLHESPFRGLRAVYNIARCRHSAVHAVHAPGGGTRASRPGRTTRRDGTGRPARTAR